jgi:RimJ/RimL family protein N-acetyltransferase
MNKALSLKNMQFSTGRLEVMPIHYFTKDLDLDDVLPNVVGILSERVVESLPPYFHGIKSTKQATVWLSKMQAESCFYMLCDSFSSDLVGFLFLYDSGDGAAHLGYLLAEKYWGVGLASELLIGLIDELKTLNLLKTLVGGVDPSNIASIKVLHKAGFFEHEKNEEGVLFFHYTF